jgi:N-acetylmuramoyl-L-alanine amidase
VKGHLQRFRLRAALTTLRRMRLRLFLLISVAAGALLALPAAACADFAHVVAPGETLSSIAAQDGLTVDQLAAANGLSPSTELVAGSTVQIPAQQSSETVASDASTGSTSIAEPASTSTVPSGSYVVQPGDTLSGIAAQAGMSVDQLAALNGLNPNAYLISGTALQLPGSSGTEFVSAGSSSSSSASSQPVGAAAEGQVTDPPYPTPQTVTASQVGSIASANGVPASLADAIAWQESGFNNDLVSSADARGVMQILPGTWQWIQSNLNPGPALAPASASDNVRGGVLLLHSLLTATGGDPALAAAGYYQGLPSVQQNGMYPSTQQYVQDVTALERQFGGGG